MAAKSAKPLPRSVKGGSYTKSKTTTNPKTTSAKSKTTSKPATTSSKVQAPGLIYSSFDNAWHPPSWFAAPKAKAPAKAAPPGGKTYGPGGPIQLGSGGQPSKMVTAGNKSPSLASIVKTPTSASPISAISPKTKGPNYTGAVTSSGGGGSTGGAGFRSPAQSAGGSIVAPTSPAVSKPVVSTPVAPPPVVSGPSGGTGTGGGQFVSRGPGGTFGRFQRQRLNRGPRSGLSITPEMLQRIAAQRIGMR